MPAGPASAPIETAGPFRPPAYASDDGRIDADVRRLLPAAPSFSLAKLALFLSQPVLEMEFAPDTPWVGIRMQRPEFRWPERSSDPRELVDRFRATVAACAGEAETIAVFFSGGLDSLAVLVHAERLSRSEDRKLVAVVVDLSDDEGTSAGEVALRLISDLDLRCEVRRIDPNARRWPEPEWQVEGPILNTMPRLNRAANDAAADAGARVMLNGLGGDELFMTRDFMIRRLVRARLWRDAGPYLRDVLRFYGPMALPRELLGMVSPLLGTKASFQLYLSLQWPELATMKPSPLLSPSYRDEVEHWSRRWLRSRFSAFEADGGDWLQALARDMVFPFDPGPRYGSVPERSPYMEEDFATFALGLPMTLSYSSSHRAPYHRHKALVLELLPADRHRFLPSYKQLFSRATHEYARTVLEGRALIMERFGLLQDGPLERLFADPRVPHVVHALDLWVEGALERGIDPVP